MAMSPTIARVRPYAHRIALPARRFSEHIASAIATPFHHPRRSIDVEPNSYFVSGHPSKVEVGLEVQAEVVEFNGVDGGTVGALGVVETVTHASPKKATKFKRIIKKTKVLLRLRRRS